MRQKSHGSINSFQKSRGASFLLRIAESKEEKNTGTYFASFFFTFYLTPAFGLVSCTFWLDKLLSANLSEITLKHTHKISLINAGMCSYWHCSMFLSFAKSQNSKIKKKHIFNGMSDGFSWSIQDYGLVWHGNTREVAIHSFRRNFPEEWW